MIRHTRRASLHSWLNSWRGIRAVERSIRDGDGTLADECDRLAWERTPWRAVQGAAWEALVKAQARR